MNYVSQEEGNDTGSSEHALELKRRLIHYHFFLTLFSFSHLLTIKFNKHKKKPQITKLVYRLF